MAAVPAALKLLQIHLRLRAGAMGVLRAVLPDKEIARWCDAHDLQFRNRFFTPLMTFWTMIAQRLGPDHSCRTAVAQALSWWRARIAPGQRRNRKLTEHSQDTGAYCRAYDRLPEQLVSDMAKLVAQRLDSKAQDGEKMWGRNVYLVDATCVSMPDTAALAAEFGRSGGGKKGCKQSLFPISRIVATISLATGALIDASIGAYRRSERALFRTMVRSADWLAGSIIVADAMYGSYPNIAWLVAHGADLISRPYSRRKVDLRKGKRLGPGDRLVTWHRNPKLHPLEPDDIQVDSITLRLVEVQTLLKGHRPKRIVLVTTLTDPERYSAEDIANLYLRRWDIEVDLRHLKTSMGMEVLSGKKPEIVRKEIWAHFATYNLVRAVMWEAAATHDFSPDGLELPRYAPAPQYLRAQHRKLPWFERLPADCEEIAEGYIT